MRLTSSKGAIGGKGGHTLDLSAFRFASAAILTLAGGGPCGSGGTPLKRGCSTTRGAGATAVPFATGFFLVFVQTRVAGASEKTKKHILLCFSDTTVMIINLSILIEI